MRRLLLLCALGCAAALQQEVTCVEESGDGPPDEWTVEHEFTPSSPGSLSVTLAETGHTPPSEGPLLNISWSLNVDGSLPYLNATIIEIDGYNRKQFRCNYKHPFNEKINYTHQNKMWFHFSGFTATPGKLYSVSALNIPPPNIGGDYDSEPEQFNTPDCTDERMRLYEYCVAMGSTWDPNITTVYRGNSVDITFTSSRHSQRYILYLYSCGPPPINLHNCDLVNNTDFTTDKPRITQTLNASQECEYLLIQIVPHFHECELNCVRVNAKVNCSQPEDKTEYPESTPSYNAGVLIAMTVAGISLCGIFILYKISWCGRNTGTSTQTPFTVLIVYPPGSSVLQKTVLIFAEFLQSHSRCKVIIDIWQRQRIAEIGPVRWLAIQKESADKIIAVCSDSTSRQWPGSSLEVRDQTVPASTEDFFILALNMFSSDLRQDLCKYMVVYFGEIAKGKSRHVALRACRSYSLMKDIEKFYHSLHNIPPNNSCCIRPASSMGPTYTTDTSKKLREAIRELKEWEELQLSSTTQDLR